MPYEVTREVYVPRERIVENIIEHPAPAVADSLPPPPRGVWAGGRGPDGKPRGWLNRRVNRGNGSPEYHSRQPHACVEVTVPYPQEYEPTPPSPSPRPALS